MHPEQVIYSRNPRVARYQEKSIINNLHISSAKEKNPLDISEDREKVT